jgi:hypothetical protein
LREASTKEITTSTKEKRISESGDVESTFSDSSTKEITTKVLKPEGR